MSDRSTRWLDGQLPDELRSVLQSARADDPSPAQLAKLRSGLEATLGEVAFISRAPTAHGVAADGGKAAEPSVTAAPAKLAPVAITVGAVVALVLAGLSLRNSSTTPSDDGSRPSGATIEQSRVVVEQAAPSAQPSAAAARATKAEKTSTELVVPASAQANPAQAEPTPAPRSVRAPARAAHEYTLAEELTSLDRIRAQLDTPPKALALAARHAKKFTNGALIPERELLELEALLREGRTDEARKLAKRMTSTDGFPYRAQVSQLLATY